MNEALVVCGVCGTLSTVATIVLIFAFMGNSSHRDDEAINAEENNV